MTDLEKEIKEFTRMVNGGLYYGDSTSVAAAIDRQTLAHLKIAQALIEKMKNDGD